MMNQGTMLDRQALFSDETENFRIPPEPDEYQQVEIRLRTAKDNVDQVYLVYETAEAVMEKYASDTWFDYYHKTIPIDNQTIHYHFEVIKGIEHCCYSKLGVENECQTTHRFCINPGFKTPEWAKGAVIYQIFVDRFYNGDSSNDPIDNEYYYINGPIRQIKNWDQYPDHMDVGNFYGGDLQGIWEKIDYIKYLGIEVIYLNPIFVSPSNHKYDVQDYDYIDPHYGIITKDLGDILPEGEKDNKNATKYISRTVNKENLEASNQFFAEFVEAAHKRGIKIILDGVFNHCGSFNKWLDRERIYESDTDYESGAYISGESPYKDYFSFASDEWPYNSSYAGWWGHSTLPKLNYEDSKELYMRVLQIGVKWVSAPYHVDGWRLDVASDLGRSMRFNHEFWRDFRKAVKAANPEALILAEHYGDASPWLQGDQWDTVMNYDAFMEPVTWFLTGMEKHSDEKNDGLYGNGDAFFRTMNGQGSQMHGQSLHIAMNELSNHDHSRFLTRTNRTIGRSDSLGPEAAEEGINKAVMREAVMIQMTWPGAPTIYYGDEAGMCGWTDPDNRRTYPWGQEDLDLIEYHRYLILFHKKYSALRKGSVKPLLASDHLIAYGRFYKKSIAVVIINNKAETRDVKIPVWQLGVTDQDLLKRMMLTNEERYNVGQIRYQSENGYLNLRLEPISGILLRREEIPG